MGLEDILGRKGRAEEKSDAKRKQKASRSRKAARSPATSPRPEPIETVAPPAAATSKRRDAARHGWERWTVYATEGTILKMKALAEDAGQPVAHLVEAALAAFLARVEEERGSIVPRERRPLDLERFT